MTGDLEDQLLVSRSLMDMAVRSGLVMGRMGTSGGPDGQDAAQHSACTARFGRGGPLQIRKRERFRPRRLLSS